MPPDERIPYTATPQDAAAICGNHQSQGNIVNCTKKNPNCGNANCCASSTGKLHGNENEEAVEKNKNDLKAYQTLKNEQD